MVLISKIKFQTKPKSKSWPNVNLKARLIAKVNACIPRKDVTRAFVPATLKINQWKRIQAAEELNVERH